MTKEVRKHPTFSHQTIPDILGNKVQCPNNTTLASKQELIKIRAIESKSIPLAPQSCYDRSKKWQSEKNGEMIEQKARRPNLGHRFRQSLYFESSRWQLRRLRLDTRINPHIRQSASNNPAWKPEKLELLISAIPDISKFDEKNKIKDSPAEPQQQHSPLSPRSSWRKA